jgi:NAD(P)-dependent dehydrogenase (short-subunit alcohol dehydrogenase family)
MFEINSNTPTVLVTGATEGIGYATARRFVDDGATVYVHAPNPESGEKAMTRMVKDGAEPLRLNLVVADFTRLDEVADLADTLTVALPGLDVLINNAAIAGPEQRTYTRDGHEVAIQVNYLAAYLLTTKLAPKLASARGRVVNVSSLLHRGGNIGWNNLSRLHQYSPLACTRNPSSRSRCIPGHWPKPPGNRSPRSACTPAWSQPNCYPSTAIPGCRPKRPRRPVTTLSSPTHSVVDGGYCDGLELAHAAALFENARAPERLEKLSTQPLASVLD